MKHALAAVLSDARGHHTKALTVALINTSAFLSGALDWLGDTGMKVLVAFLVALFSGLGYQIGVAIWRRLTSGEKDTGR
jgi:hypothetical protein